MRKRQSGVFLISAAVAVAVVGLLISFWGINQSRHMRIEKAERVGEALKAVGGRVESFVVAHHHEIDALLRDSKRTFEVNGVTFVQKSDALGRFVGNLDATTLIKVTGAVGMGTTPPGNVGEYAIRVYPACDAKGTCNVETLTYISKPMLKRYSAEPDIDAAVIAARKIGALGGVSSDEGKKEFRFLDSGGSTGCVFNPVGAAGLVAIRGGYATSAQSVFVRRDGSKMKGPLDFEERDKNDKTITRHNIVGVGEVKANTIVADGKVKAKQIEITGSANIKGELDLSDQGTNHSIVGAKDITGTGTLQVGQANVTGTANVGSLHASKGATLGGALKMQGKNIDEAGDVSAKNLLTESFSAESGVVQLKKGKMAGTTCDVWGLTRDDDGKLLSCQRSSPGSNYWVWKLASTPGSVKEVPKEIIKEIEKAILVDQQWRVSRFSLAPSREGAKLGSALYFYVSSRRDAKVLACTIVNGNGQGAELRAAKDQGNFIVTQSPSGREQLICLSKGSGTPNVGENAWYWWGWPTFDEHGGYLESGRKSTRWNYTRTYSTMPPIHEASVKPISVVADKDARKFNEELQVLFRTFGLESTRSQLNYSIAMVTTTVNGRSDGNSWWLFSRPANMASCKIRANFNGRLTGDDASLTYEPGGIWFHRRAAYGANIVLQCAIMRQADWPRGMSECTFSTCPLR